MCEFNVGDLVEARKGETRIVARLLWSGDCLFFDGWGAGVLSAVDQGFTLSLVEAATPPLPTEPGVYLDKWGDTWQLSEETIAFAERWFLGSDFMTHNVARGYAPFTKLESVPDTAKKVIDATIRTFNSKGGNIVDALMSVSQEFGVES